MVLLKPFAIRCDEYPVSEFTFHYGSSQTSFCDSTKEWPYKIYIPLWFFSNTLPHFFCYASWNLHSTMVLLKLSAYENFVGELKFTFHYGSSQTTIVKLALCFLHNLHSTMVLLKRY